MKKSYELPVMVILFFSGVVVGLFFMPREQSHPPNNEDIKSSAESETSRELSMPQMVADQLRTGNLTCPNFDVLTYEACLLFQGALGTWQIVGKPDTCPEVVGDGLISVRLSQGKGSQVTSEHSLPSPKIRPEDALRAADSTCFGYLYAIQVANVTPILVSTPNRTFQMASGAKFSEPGSNPNACLQVRHGICGNHTAVGMALFRMAGFVARSLEFYYEKDGQRLNHVIPEVWINQKWRPVDTTYGAYWVNHVPQTPFELIDTDSLISNRNQSLKPMRNNAILPYGFYSTISRPTYFEYLSSDADIIRGGHGTARIALAGVRGKEIFSGKPNYIGDTAVEGKHAGIDFRFIESSSATFKLTVKVLDFNRRGNEPIEMCVDHQCSTFAKERTIYEFSVPRPQRLYLKSPTGLACLALHSIEWERIM